MWVTCECSVPSEPSVLSHLVSSESAATLEAESGYTMESSEVSEFRQCILNGAWDSAEAALMRLGVADDDGLWVSVPTAFQRTTYSP